MSGRGVKISGAAIDRASQLFDYELPEGFCEGFSFAGLSIGDAADNDEAPDEAEIEALGEAAPGEGGLADALRDPGSCAVSAGAVCHPPHEEGSEGLEPVRGLLGLAHALQVDAERHELRLDLWGAALGAAHSTCSPRGCKASEYVVVDGAEDDGGAPHAAEAFDPITHAFGA